MFFPFVEVVDLNALEVIGEEDVEDVVLMLLIMLLLQQKLDAGVRLLHELEPLLKDYPLAPSYHYLFVPWLHFH